MTNDRGFMAARWALAGTKHRMLSEPGFRDVEMAWMMIVAARSVRMGMFGWLLVPASCLNDDLNDR